MEFTDCPEYTFVISTNSKRTVQPISMYFYCCQCDLYICFFTSTMKFTSDIFDYRMPLTKFLTWLRILYNHDSKLRLVYRMLDTYTCSPVCGSWHACCLCDSIYDCVHCAHKAIPECLCIVQCLQLLSYETRHRKSLVQSIVWFHSVEIGSSVWG